MRGARMVLTAVRRKKEAQRKALLEMQNQKDEAELNAWFEKYDKEANEHLSRSEVENLLTEVKRELLGDPNAVVRPELLERIMKTFDISGDGQIEKQHALGAVKKYKAILKNEALLDELFTKHDQDHSGTLSSPQLKALLTELSGEMSNTPKVTDADVEWVQGKCQKQAGEALNRLELNMAVAVWKEAAKYVVAEPEEHTSSMACVLL